MTKTVSCPIKIQQLSKFFGRTQALDGLDMEVRSGEIHGFLGPNGAGKSTTIRILLGLIRSSGGRVEVLGGNPWHEAVELHGRMAYVPDEVNLWPNLSGGEVIDILAGFRGGFDAGQREELIEAFRFDPSKKFRTYSRGNRQKAAIISALMSEAELYIMDEPTSGLDPLMEEVFQDYVRGLRDQGKTVLFSSHVLAEVEKLCDRVTIIREGRAVESGSLDELRHLTRTRVRAVTRQSLPDWSARPGIHGFETDGNEVSFEVEAQQLEAVMQELSSHGLRNVTATPPTLGELFMQHYSEEKRPESDRERV